MSTHANELTSYRYNASFAAAPLAIWTLSVLADIATHLMGSGSSALLELSYRLLAIGIVGAIALSIWSGLNMRAFRGVSHDSEVALTHEALLLGGTLLAIGSIFWRELSGFVMQAPVGSIALSSLAITMLAGSMATRALAHRSPSAR